MSILTLLPIICFILFINEPVKSFSQHPKLLVISYDAFRYDYINTTLTPFMNYLKNKSTYADYMRNVFVTKTFPNHHTIATGLYAETHGVMDNEVFDTASGNIIKYSYELFHYNKDILPIWTINEKAGNGRHSGTMMWPGSAFPYQEIEPKFAQTFNGSVPWEDRIDMLVSWFVHPSTPINFGMLYIEEPDTSGHALGIHGPVFEKILKKLDYITRYLYDKLDQYGLKDINVIHLSDHGMASVTMERIINLTKYVDDADYDIVGTSPGLHIFPKPGKEELVYRRMLMASQEIPHFKVYKRQDIPKKYHYGDNPRVGPIFIIPDVGYAFQIFYNTIQYYEKSYNFTANNKTEFGLHGYDNEATEMRPIFFARGPAFKLPCKLEPFNNVDLFPLFCEILDLKCSSVNGTLEHTQSCLKMHSGDIMISTLMMAFIGTIFAVMLIGTTVTLIIFLIRRRCRVTKANYRSVSTVIERSSVLRNDGYCYSDDIFTNTEQFRYIMNVDRKSKH